MNKRDVQDALGRSLSGLKENPFLAQQIIAKEQGEKTMKRKSVGALALIAALILAVMGTAYALFQSEVAEFFGQQFGADLGNWLSRGRVAQIGEFITLDGVVFTLNEVVYRDRSLYGIGTARPENSQDVLVPVDLDAVPDFFQQDETALALASQAKASGGRLLTITALPEQIGVDGGALLTPDSVGYYDVRQEDGSLTFSFHVTDGFSIEEGTSYQLRMCCDVHQLSETGEFVPDSLRQLTWTVECAPIFMAEESAEQEQEAVRIPDGQADDYAILVPDAYRETDTMPVYRATEADMTGLIRPELFNQSGIAEARAEDYLIFKDHAQLQMGREGLYYQEYTDEMYDYNTREREQYDPALAPDMGPKQALSADIASIAAEVYAGRERYGSDIRLERERLTNISLKDAQETAEALLASLHIEGFSCAYALDMTTARIQDLGQIYHRFWFEGGGYTNKPPQDFDAATVDDEGYFLIYTPLGVDHVSDHHQEAILYVTARGITYANITQAFERGPVVYTPETLIAPQAAVEKLYEAISASRYGGEIVSIQRVALTYSAIRAEKKEGGMIFAP
ncbi:MAG: hypothetical protein IJ240_03010, partial [Clostridia bacterium]|nr:hypothetical protein [Clostridia bacterium]